MKWAHYVVYWLWKVLPIPRWGRWLLLWWTNTKFLVGVVGVVLDDEQRVLVARHTYRQRYPWGLPGGWVGAQESLEAALVRELVEETGMRVSVGAVLQIKSDYPRPQLDSCFLCRYEGGQFVPNAEIAEVRFCRLDELPTLMLPSQRLMITSVLAHAHPPPTL